VVLKAVRSKSPKTRNATEDAALHKRCDVNLKNKHRAIAKWQIAAINAEHTQVEGHLSSGVRAKAFSVHVQTSHLATIFVVQTW